MARGEIHVGDQGVAFIVTIKDENDAVVDLTSANLLQMKFKKPSESLLAKTATLLDGPNGKIQYIAESGFLDERGTWRLQGYVGLSGNYYNTDISTFKVMENL